VSSVLLLAVAQWRTLDFRLAAALGTTMARPGHTGERCDRHQRMLGVTKATATDRMPGTQAGKLVTGFPSR